MYKRIIPCLDIRNGRTVKGIQFESIRDAGDPAALAALYAQQGADELVLLDISATIEERSAFIPVVETVASRINIPFTVGGGISSVETAYGLLRAGADKISVNSAAVFRPELISDLATQFGSQCVVVAMDVKRHDNDWIVYTHGGRNSTGISMQMWINRVVELGAGELLITSMDGDGTKNGFDCDCYQTVGKLTNLPVIASGGAGSVDHFEELFGQTAVTGGLAASIFHFGELPVPVLKTQLQERGIRMRLSQTSNYGIEI